MHLRIKWYSSSDFEHKHCQSVRGITVGLARLTICEFDQCEDNLGFW